MLGRNIRVHIEKSREPEVLEKTESIDCKNNTNGYLNTLRDDHKGFHIKISQRISYQDIS